MLSAINTLLYRTLLSFRRLDSTHTHTLPFLSIVLIVFSLAITSTFVHIIIESATSPIMSNVKKHKRRSLRCNPPNYIQHDPTTRGVITSGQVSKIRVIPSIGIVCTMISVLRCARPLPQTAVVTTGNVTVRPIFNAPTRR